jgi:putative spermidine/putrescine transport system permease protein
LIAFLTITFVVPILWVLATSVGNSKPRQVLPQTYAALATWNRSGVPDEAVFAAFAQDLKIAQDNRTVALVGKRLNYEISGIHSKFLATTRRVATMENGPWKSVFVELDPVWGEPETWSVIARNGGLATSYYLLNALDLERMRTAAIVTGWTLLLGYPVAYVLSIAPPLDIARPHVARAAPIVDVAVGSDNGLGCASAERGRYQ